MLHTPPTPRAGSSERLRRTARRRRWCSARISRPRRRHSSTLRRHAVSGLSAACAVSDRFLPATLLQTVDRAYRDSTDLIRRFHRRGRLLRAR